MVKEFNLSEKIKARKLIIQKKINEIEKLECPKCNMYKLCPLHKTQVKELLLEKYHIDKITKIIKEFIKILRHEGQIKCWGYFDDVVDKLVGENFAK